MHAMLIAAMARAKRNLMGRVLLAGLMLAAAAIAMLFGPGMTAEALAQTAELGGLDIVYGGTLTLTLQSDQTLNKAGGVKPFNNTYSEPELDWFVNFGQHFSVNGLFKMEQVRAVSETDVFRAEGAWIDELYATISFDPVRFYGGKIHPSFGKAWDATPGLYGTDFAEDYELVEKIGIGAAVDINLAGRHTIAVESFFNDTTVLSNSIFSRPKITDANVLRPGRAHRSDGGVGNTGDLDNFTVSLEGRKIPELAGFAYNIGWSYQQGSKVGGEFNEQAWVAGFEWEIPLTSRITVVPMFEYARVADQGGVDVTAQYFTAGLGMEFGQGWSASAHGTIRPIRDHGTPDRYTDHLLGFSVGYDLGARLRRYAKLLDGLGVEAGYKHERVARDDLNTVGIAFTYERKF